MKKQGKILYLIVTLLEVGLLAGTYILNYFTKKKLGINRQVNFICSRWEKSYPIPQIKIIIILALVALTVLALCLYLKRKDARKKMVGVMAVLSCVISLITIGYMLFYSFEKMRAYYLICLMLVAATTLQLGKTFVGIRVWSNEE